MKINQRAFFEYIITDTKKLRLLLVGAKIFFIVPVGAGASHIHFVATKIVVFSRKYKLI